MPTHKGINDLQLSFFTAGELDSRPVVKILQGDDGDCIYILTDEIRPLGEWLIQMANEANLASYVAPFGADFIPFDGAPMTQGDDGDNVTPTALGFEPVF